MAQQPFPASTNYKTEYQVRYRPPGEGGGFPWGTVLVLAGAGLVYLDLTGKLQPLLASLRARLTGQPTGAAGTPSTSGTPASSSPSPTGASTTPGALAPTAVTLTGPSTGTVGQPITVQAQATGVGHPLYQFWLLPPGGAQPVDSQGVTVQGIQNGWISVQGYGPNALMTFVPERPGSYLVVAYARDVTAPSHENETQRGIYETQSAPLTIQVTAAGDPVTVGGAAFAAVPRQLATYGRTVQVYAGPWPGIPGGVGIATYDPRGNLRSITVGIYRPGLQDQIGSVATGQYLPPGAYVMVTG